MTSTPRNLPNRVDELLARMSLEEKVGQLFMVFFQGPALSSELREMIERYHIGGIVLFSISGNVESPRQVAELINDAQSSAVASGAGIPLFVSVDQEGGSVVRLRDGFTVLPSQMAVGATGSSTLAAQMARVMAAELRALGFNMNLAPVLDVNNNANNPVIGVRSFSSDPQAVRELGRVMLQAYAESGILPVVKHFPGHGDTAVDSHFGLPLVPHERSRLDAVEFLPFRAAIDAGAPAIMTAHVLFPAIDPDPNRPATLSPAVLTDLLRGEFGFEGLIITDSLGMGALKNLVGTVEAAHLAFRAGADVLAFGADIGATVAEQKAAYARLLEQVQSGEISTQRLDASVRRILETKAAAGLLEWQPVNPANLSTQVNTPAHRQLALEVAQASITLVRNQETAIPLQPEESVLVAWPQTVGDLGEALARCRADLILRPLSLDPTATEVEQILADAPNVSRVVVGTFNARQHPAQVEMIKDLAAYDPVVAALGQPYDLLDFPEISTYVASYGTVPASLEALAQVLCGDIAATGTLPVDLPNYYERGWRVSSTKNSHLLYLPSTQKPEN